MPDSEPKEDPEADPAAVRRQLQRGEAQAALTTCLSVWQTEPEDSEWLNLLVRSLLQVTQATARQLRMPASKLAEPSLLKIMDGLKFRHPDGLETLWQAHLESGLRPTPTVVQRFCMLWQHSNQAALAHRALSSLLAAQPQRLYLLLNRACLAPVVYAQAEEPARWRAAALKDLHTVYALLQTRGTAALKELAADWAGLYTPSFLWAYQGLDNRELYEVLGAIWTQVLAGLNPLSATAFSERRVLRVGFVSAHFFEHSVAHAYLELVRYFQAAGAETELYAVRSESQHGATEPWTEMASFQQVLGSDLQDATRRIRERQPDILIYPEVGMDFNTYLLAAQRLAPLQMVLSGHPETTGLTTLDYFVSSRGRELPEAQAHYSEKLLLLPQMPVIAQAPTPVSEPLTRADFGLSEALNYYLCPMMPFKIHPENDALFAGILRTDPRAQILCFEYGSPLIREALVARFQLSLGDLAERVLWLPFQAPERFKALVQQLPVALDTRQFGGGNTVRLLLGLGVPLLTWPGAWMKQRVAAEALYWLELPELVVDSASAYVATAVRLANDTDFRTTIQTRLRARAGRLFGQTEGAEALLQFCLGESGKVLMARSATGENSDATNP